MQDSINPQRRTRMPRTRLLAAAALTILVSACGGSSISSTATVAGARTARSRAAANVGAAATTGSSRAAGGGAATSGSAPQGAGGPGLAFSRCMRANGVPNFPDPVGNGELFDPAGIDRSSPAFKTAQAKCGKLLQGGPPLPGTTTHPSAHTLAKLLGIARCMRDHGVPQFPDPRTSVPPNPFGSGAGVITDYDGAILLFPSTLNQQSPAYEQAATACGALAQKLGRGPH